MSEQRRAMVIGAGGFIGGHLTRRLIAEDYYVTAVDVKPFDDWWQPNGDAQHRVELFDAGEFHRYSSRFVPHDEVYNLAADMGGIGFIESHRADCMLSVLASTNVLRGVRNDGWKATVFYASSACVYPADRQDRYHVTPLREEDAYPADPEDGYGWEKLFSERMHRHFHEDYGVDVRVARYHNVYGPYGTWTGGREKAPAALCRKVAIAKLTREPMIEVWGSGTQTRSFCYVDDCVEGTLRLMRSDFTYPLNVGSSYLVTIDELVTLIETVADVQVEHRYLPNAATGVRGRNSDNTTILDVLHWQPPTPLLDGLERTYAWVEDRVREKLGD